MKKSTKRFVLSDETINVYGFKVLTAGIDLTSFKLNPIMLYDHDYSKPIGQWEDLEVTDNKLTGVPSFDENDPEAMKFYSKVEQGILRGASIGFTPLQFNEQTQTMEKSLVNETSITPVPGNKKALAMYNADGQRLSTDQAKEYLLSLKPIPTETKTDNKKQKMKQGTISALVALCVQAGHNITLSANSTDEEFEGAIRKVGERLTSLSADKITLSAKLKKIEDDAKEAQKKELDKLISDAVEDKRLNASEIEEYKTLGQFNLSLLKTQLEKLKPVELHTVTTTGKEEQQGDGKQADDKSKWTFDQYAENGELEALQLSNPKKFQTLLSAKQEQARKTHSIEA